MEINFSCNTTIDITSPKLKDITKNLIILIPFVVQEYFRSVLLEFAEYYMRQPTKPFSCNICGNNTDFTWKTHKGKTTFIQSIFCLLTLYQLQVKCSCCNHKMYITRKLLGVEMRKRIPYETILKLGLIGALTTFGVAKKIVGMFGITLNKMSIWRAVQRLGKDIKFDIDPNEMAEGEADGTGIPINGIKKRGKEMKVFVQKKKNGGVKISGLTIGNYDGEWDKLFKPLIPALSKFKQFLLITDGDTNILKGLKGKVKVLYQRCLWHIPHQFKWYLWKDGVKHKSVSWKAALAQLYNITNIKSIIDNQAKECIEEIVLLKEKSLDILIESCRDKGWKHCETYLTNAKDDMFKSLSNRLNGKTTSHAERVMKNINMRASVGKWSTRGILNATKIRLAYYYNGWDVV